MIQCDTIGMWLGANCFLQVWVWICVFVRCSAVKSPPQICIYIMCWMKRVWVKHTQTHTHSHIIHWTVSSMWLLRVVLLDRHNIWDVHGCRSHTTFCLILLYLLHSAYKNYRFDLKTGIHCIWRMNAEWQQKKRTEHIHKKELSYVKICYTKCQSHSQKPGG